MIEEEIASAPLSTSASSGKALLAMTMPTTITMTKTKDGCFCPALGWRSLVDYRELVDFAELSNNPLAIRHLHILCGASTSRIPGIDYEYEHRSG
jgi:hypothetical protein